MQMITPSVLCTSTKYVCGNVTLWCGVFWWGFWTFGGGFTPPSVVKQALSQFKKLPRLKVVRMGLFPGFPVFTKGSLRSPDV